MSLPCVFWWRGPGETTMRGLVEGTWVSLPRVVWWRGQVGTATRGLVEGTCWDCHVWSGGGDLGEPATRDLVEGTW